MPVFNQPNTADTVDHGGFTADHGRFTAGLRQIQADYLPCQHLPTSRQFLLTAGIGRKPAEICRHGRFVQIAGQIYVKSLVRQGLRMRSSRGVTADPGRNRQIVFQPRSQPRVWTEHGIPAELVVCALVVPGRPVPKARARTVSPNRKVISFTPERTKQAEQRIVVAFKLLYPGQRPVVDVRLGLQVHFYFNRMAPGDTDNYIKLLKDALNNVAYKDDKQVRKYLDCEVFDHWTGEERTEFVVYLAPGRGSEP